ncbi:hypothetical protein SAMN04488096_10429 [Mesonia phycicola]|uniref:YqcI/YcgG family protein n=2 Tax=Mesonia phycicola TaxID=579105 RepID=A0A1M6DK16_9FLAO|nr:hypothetical protein SAMN04488096_10429 [Mesonia phycicola]
MAQTVFNQNNVLLYDYQHIADEKKSKKLLEDLNEYVVNYNFHSKKMKSFIAVFSQEKPVSEKEFEHKLWKQLQLLSNLDKHDWDNTVNADPNHKDFSYSLLGKSFYIVGMHPNSSRLARKSPSFALVFNLHVQFEKLREMNIYTSIRNRIRKRDKQLQGSINPMLEDFGEGSEARQYSGRKVEESWKCPFH